MGLLEELWRRSGLTIVLVTHDRTIAATAPLIVRMRDGRIEGDGSVAERLAVPEDAA